MIITKIDKPGRVVIPASYREVLGICEKDTLLFSPEGETVCIRATKRLCRLCGAFLEREAEVSLCSACIDTVKKH